MTAAVNFNPAAAGNRPYITVGTPAGANTLLLSASTGNVVVAPVAGNVGYTIVTTETAGNCPTKVISANSHWTGGGGIAAIAIPTIARPVTAIVSIYKSLLSTT